MSWRPAPSLPLRRPGRRRRRVRRRPQSRAPRPFPRRGPARPPRPSNPSLSAPPLRRPRRPPPWRDRLHRRVRQARPGLSRARPFAPPARCGLRRRRSRAASRPRSRRRRWQGGRPQSRRPPRLRLLRLGPSSLWRRAVPLPAGPALRVGGRATFCLGSRRSTRRGRSGQAEPMTGEPRTRRP